MKFTVVVYVDEPENIAVWKEVYEVDAKSEDELFEKLERFFKEYDDKCV